MKKFVQKLAKDRSGATAIEYGLIAAFIALAMVVALPGIKSGLQSKFQAVETNLASDSSSASTPSA